MSLKTKFFSFLTVVIGVAAFSTFTFAQDNKAATPSTDKIEKPRGEGREFGKRKFDGEGFGGHRGRHGGKFHGLRGIDLTDAQKEQIRVIRENNKPDAATMQEFKAIREARKAGTAITPEQKERMKALHEQSRAKAESVHQQILAVLTADQKAQIEKMKLEMKQRHEERIQKRQQNPAAADKPKIS